MSHTPGSQTQLKQLMELDELKRIVRGDSDIDATQLERDFLLFSRYNTKRQLNVRLPRLYTLEGDQNNQMAAAIASLGLKTDRLPNTIDISGSFDHRIGQDAFIFLSLRQIETDHYSTTDSFLDPLIEKVYSDALRLIRDFGIHEPVAGKVLCRRGNLNLQELQLFPERFVSGQYTLSVELDTPTGAVRKFIELSDLLDEFRDDPKNNMLDYSKIDNTTDRALALRKMLGSLSRYERPSTQLFEVNTNSCIIRTDNNTQFYLYLENQKKNVLVYFGDAPFEIGKQPRDLQVLRGKDHQDALVSLVSLGIFEPSLKVLEQRINGLKALYDDAARGSGKPIGSDYSNAQILLDKLESTKNYLEHIVNPDIRRDYLVQQPTELLEFIVHPSSVDPLLYELLARLSWSKSVRNYANTNKFISQFECSDENTKRQMLREISSNVLFGTQQNNDVNCWLYNNYSSLANTEGINFKVFK